MNRAQDTPSPHIVFAGDAIDLPWIIATLRRLPEGAYGHIFVEIAVPMQQCTPDLPAGMSLTWLIRQRPDQTIRPRGERLAQALRGWCSEWLTEPDPSVRHLIWVGGVSTPRMSELYRELHSRFPRHVDDALSTHGRGTHDTWTPWEGTT